MTLAMKDGAETDKAQKISLGGKDYYVPRLTLRQRIAIAAKMTRVQTLAEQFQQAKGLPADFNVDSLSPLIEVIQQALLGYYPGVTCDDILDLDCDMGELMEAVPVIARQAASRRATAGEQQAAGDMNTTKVNGESSSPI